MLVIAYSTLGFIFGIRGGRPGWFSALQAPGFVVMAGVSGIGMLIIIAYLLRKIYKLEDVINERTFRTLGLMLMILIITYIYLMIVEELTANYAAPKKDREVAHAIVLGPYAPYFWTTVATLLISAIILFYQFVSGKVKILPTVISGFLVNIAAFCKRFIIVVPSQTHGLLLPYQEGHYSPTIVEIAVVVGLFGLGILAYITFAKIFPLIPLDTLSTTYKAEIMRSEEVKFSRILRVSLSIFTLLLGISLMVVGFLSSARFWTEYYSDPVIPFAPVVFILGVILSFTSAVVYEVLPGKYKTSSSHQTV
jgi:Ni/Fe-hydrogenase subunit HybB-like protein